MAVFLLEGTDEPRVYNILNERSELSSFGCNRGVPEDLTTKEFSRLNTRRVKATSCMTSQLQDFLHSLKTIKPNFSNLPLSSNPLVGPAFFDFIIDGKAHNLYYNATMQLKDIQIEGFRSFGKLVHISGLKKYNLFIGKNNAGKSNVLKLIPFISDFLSKLPQIEGAFSVSARNSIHTDVLDHLLFEQKENSRISLKVLFELDAQEMNIITNSGQSPLYTKELQTHKPLISIEATIQKSGSNFAYCINELNIDNLPIFSKSLVSVRDVNNSFTKFDESRYNDLTQNPKVHKTYAYLYQMLHNLQSIFANKLVIIKAFRKIAAYKNITDRIPEVREIFDFLDFDGVNSLDILKTLILPNNNASEPRRRYREVNKFVSTLLDTNVTLLTNDNLRDLSVELSDGNVSSIKSWGSSVEELVMIAINIINYKPGSIVSFEEPETHLDPAMQRKLLTFLRAQTDHQYLVSSHSPVFINEFTTDDSEIYRVCNLEGSTTVEAKNAPLLHKILDDLGTKASDLLQSNGIIWVEGPSDRIYIKAWLDLLCTENNSVLQEGLDYSFVYYGGSVLSNFSIGNTEDDLSETDFIDMLKINRNVAVIMDRDVETGRKWKTKNRIVTEIAGFENALSWITEGKEIENYLSQRAIDATYPNKLKSPYNLNAKTPFEDFFRTTKENTNNTRTKTFYSSDKVKFAKDVSSQLSITDLKLNQKLYLKVQELYSKVKRWSTV